MNCKNSRKYLHVSDADANNCICNKWFQRICWISLLVCFVVISCCIYCTLVLLRIQELQEHLKEISPCGNCKSDQLNPQDVVNLKREVMRQVNIQVMSVVARHVNNITTRIKRAKDIKKRNKFPKLVAAHYEQRTKHEFLTDINNYTHARIIDTCKPIKQWNGKLCKTGDFKSNTKTLQVFEKSTSLKKTTDPFKEVKDGKFIIKKKGTYLVYAQVSFYDSKEFQQMKVVHRQKKTDKVIQEHACARGLHNYDKSVNNTCSITALFYLDRGDYLTVDLFDTDLNLNFSTNNTFLGAILLR